MQHAGGYRPRDGALPVEWIVAHHPRRPVRGRSVPEAAEANGRSTVTTETRLRGCVRSPMRTGLACSSLKKCK